MSYPEPTQAPGVASAPANPDRIIEPQPTSTFRRQLPIILLTRTTLNASIRIIYPFLPAIARGLDISLAAASQLVTLRLLASMVAPVLGPAADRLGRRRVMEAALIVFMLGGIGVGAETVLAAAAGFTLFGLAKSLYDPALHGHVADAVPYEARGRAVGAIELSWSAAWLLCVPLAGFLMETFDWPSPWLALTVVAAIALWWTRRTLPSVPQPPSQGVRSLRPRELFRAWRSLLAKRPVLALLGAFFLLSLAVEVPFIVYGAWIESTFGLGLAAIGVASTVIGVAEATAEVGTIAMTDRLGKRRSATLGLLALTVSLAILPQAALLGLAGALIGIALMMVTFEFAIVSLLPIATELEPAYRATLFSLAVATSGLGRITGDLLGGWLWHWENIAVHATLGAGCALCGALMVFFGLRGYK